jgi:hypothetical protein
MLVALSWWRPLTDRSAEQCHILVEHARGLGDFLLVQDLEASVGASECPRCERFHFSIWRRCSCRRMSRIVSQILCDRRHLQIPRGEGDSVVCGSQDDGITSLIQCGIGAGDSGMALINILGRRDGILRVTR